MSSHWHGRVLSIRLSCFEPARVTCSATLDNPVKACHGGVIFRDYMFP